ncbi:pyridoxal phosphate-dependent transferase [Xylariales sp. PMI_506]|nr:pyridoxal phosphate-dependent transferase [Xylariales sp. PMI_506]
MASGMATTYAVSQKTQEVVDLYTNHVAGGFNPYPIALVKAKGSKAWDVDGKEYIDFLSMFSVVNFGHSHPKIVEAAVQAVQEGAVVNMPFHSPYYGQLAKRLHELFGYDRFVGLTSGGEAADAAVKIARKWGYLKKGIPEGQCYVLTASACYHGVTLSTVSMRSEHQKADYYGPFMPQVGPVAPSGKLIRYGEIDDIREAFEADGDKIAAVMVEPIQGSAGIIVPPAGYLKEIETLCRKHNILFIADEIQSGLGRAGANLAHLREDVRPDLVVLGKALAGGMYPLSGVMGDSSIMSLIDYYEIGSTMAATPIACASALAAMDVLVDENIAERANEMGKLLISTLEAANPPHIKEYMGSGLFWGVVLNVSDKVTPRRLASLAGQRGLLFGPAGANRIRVCPPLTITREEILKGAEILIEALRDLETVGVLPAE